MPKLSKKWTMENPYIYIDKQYPRRFVIFWEHNKQKSTAYARWLWIKHYGQIPKGKLVHHINGDKLDDRIENFELFQNSGHTTYHNKQRSKTIGKTKK